MYITFLKLPLNKYLCKNYQKHNLVYGHGFHFFSLYRLRFKSELRTIDVIHRFNKVSQIFKKVP